MFFLRLVWILLGVWIFRSIVSLVSRRSSSARRQGGDSPATPKATDRDEILTDQRIEEAEFEELPQDRS